MWLRDAHGQVSLRPGPAAARTGSSETRDGGPHAPHVGNPRDAACWRRLFCPHAPRPPTGLPHTRLAAPAAAVLRLLRRRRRLHARGGLSRRSDHRPRVLHLGHRTPCAPCAPCVPSSPNPSALLHALLHGRKKASHASPPSLVSTCLYLCRRGDSNPHEACASADFKSAAAAISPPRHGAQHGRANPPAQASAGSTTPRRLVCSPAGAMTAPWPSP